MQSTAIRDRGYARPELLVESDWLAQHLSDPQVRVIDARQPKQYAAGHLPGAANLNGFGGIPRAANGDMANPDDFAAIASNLGISNDIDGSGNWARQQVHKGPCGVQDKQKIPQLLAFGAIKFFIL